MNAPFSSPYRTTTADLGAALGGIFSPEAITARELRTKRMIWRLRRQAAWRLIDHPDQREALIQRFGLQGVSTAAVTADCARRLYVEVRGCRSGSPHYSQAAVEELRGLLLAQRYLRRIEGRARS